MQNLSRIPGAVLFQTAFHERYGWEVIKIFQDFLKSWTTLGRRRRKKRKPKVEEENKC
jgi:hypothetical protein